jgi:hypothetical protein
MRLGFIVNADEKGKLLITDISSVQDPIANLIQLIMNEALHDRTGYTPSENAKTKYRYAFPLAGKGNPGKHPVYLQFSGEPLNFPVHDRRVPAPNPSLASYRDAYLTFKSKKFAEFTVLHTPESETKIREFVSSLTAGNTERLSQRILADKYVKFLLNADPVYLVFYTSFPGDDWPSGALGFDYVYKDPASGKYLITNFLVQGFLDDILKDPALFNQLVFKPAMKPGAPKSLNGN